MTAASPQLTLTARLNLSAAEARRGIVRVHPEVLAALALREWDGVAVIGSRTTAAVIAATSDSAPTGIALLDELTLSNAGLKADAPVVLSPAVVHGATRVVVRGSALTSESVDEPTLRRALLGKVVSVADVVSLLPRDLGPDFATSGATRTLARSVGITWTNELLTVVGAEPAGPVSVQPNTAVLWADKNGALPAPSTADQPASAPAATATTVAPPPPPPARTVDELVGVDTQVDKLTEWLGLALDNPELLTTLGAQARLGVVLTGPPGVGKATVARAVCAGRELIYLDGPVTGAVESSARLAAVKAAAAQLVSRPTENGAVLLISDVEALLPAEADPVSALILDALRVAITAPRVALICTSSAPENLDPRLRDPDLCDRELSIGLPDNKIRRGLLSALLDKVPTETLDLAEIASRTPGFVAADLAALTREAALRAAARSARDGEPPKLIGSDLTGALEVIRPVSRSASPEVAVGSLTLEDVGDMVETKQALTEAVLWPLRHPDTFTRLGVDPPRGVLLYGPPGCGKTFVVRALAASGQLSVHSVKGAELMDKWVGSSEKAVRDLFDRARESAPSLIFLDEIDALAPRRGQSSDSGVGDRVVAALLTELDGVEPLRDVVVLGATNRPDLIDPALLRPGRLERLVFVPPPDAAARGDILRTSSKSVPLAEGISLDELALTLDGYSAADCAALLREAALAAMRRNIDAATVTADDVAAARDKVRPSLDPEQVENLRQYADKRGS
ncbi:transitional endoplasmic reticulum ATPase [Williamsia limnetica]|uniref:Transitional endoplasmic reticulum ATPase n=1 Tax=Williamsia limnetica TaxID=882452 RepID=A0A318RM12_WILLI|nr:AAA family ATPase [Williamsia limnetica]PYE16776.1 transitional endoplasmic reticulum ATPase [Williamsia limnetica]